ncbi:MAG: hypothetical protein LBV52_05305 [Spirochaetaceae bacterium]|jgi:hypothetical protein|nr:hypothetical protein [Spirochaetaceae bacterium]
MTIQQTIAIPANHQLTMKIPCEIPVGSAAKVNITVFTAFDADVKPKLYLSQATANAKLRGLLKGRGITMERFEEMQREDLLLENEIDERL